MASYYPLEYTAQRNLNQSFAPVPLAQVYVFESGPGGQMKPLFPDATGTPGTALQQPIDCDNDGFMRVYTTPGRVRVDMLVDEFLTVSTEMVIADDDHISVPVLNEHPQGAVNGVNKVFVLNQVPMGSDVAFFVNGTLWDQIAISANPVGRQYNVEGAVIDTGDAPQTGDIIRVIYTPVRT